MGEAEEFRVHPEYWRQQADTNPEVHAAFILAYESKILALINESNLDGDEKEEWEHELRIKNPSLLRYEWVAQELGLNNQSEVVEEAIQIYSDRKRN
ncbi:MAG: hypothetical protein COT92_00925 [Candidatus Doudnabacteria bacterium CG10_big_fil_rev_8_21_14_0_10_42_18]|uniref:Uncharacterized protein n=1 Tax=Candidatus Doudnabacteria bacterium CG10_big_fil_rev_8_21_14_0_10_42_18 TaxID=1974552 RepID=A0A2H0VBJ3_9BACT|nr:MAG: hypothetical protein COT92_00925 [Candidatus Doudnabacteria bacterium CG10_big_fil_rev_8_21_14_0_10_42_18]